ncbi:GlsB/YeaQ/YmgE family stress response membrane protein [Canibacter sp. lx-72]|uniref:GlsB/YeaQ/YmgE family stress response membrane protein n=1 Tax=Canibacter zhuwentaonis TaxID=2837491 RepID=UPI001BDD7FDE|nr:GlsB/YeaQ/YmgE family stress response membrane protein [Canibacter zhuwentaonis]MBT1017537.1 GlsB/YeaQ/YmgE family stress response membrane protein [Canibacter zhuwentaonis]MBT1034748.1 GlsB/YeaQ/YmgE family stress response membrane protein [Canibacter zhuwentaonis]
MGFIPFIILGLIAGAIAKLILPGRQGGGWFATMILGVVGALVGGWLGGLLFNLNLENFWSFQSWALAILGSLLVLFVWGLITRKKK